MEYATPIIVAIFGSTLLSAVFNQMINWRASSRGESQFNSWNRQIEEIERLEKAASGSSSSVDGIAKGWGTAARAEAISSISKRLVPSKWGVDVFFVSLGSVAFIVGLSMVIALISGGVPEGSQGTSLVVNSIFFTFIGVLGLFTSISNEMTVSSVRNKISVALYCNFIGKGEIQDDSIKVKSERIQSVGKYERLWLGPAVANTASRLISELQQLESPTKPDVG